MRIKFLKPKDELDLVAVLRGTDGDARYYSDGSGHIILSDGWDDFFDREDGKVNHHIEYLEEFIEKIDKQKTICKRAIKSLQAVNKKLSKCKSL